MRCFIAAWPGASARVALAALSDHVRTRMQHRRATTADDLHLTLAFIGDIADDAAFAVAAAIARLRVKPFDYRLDTLGFFGQAGIVWMGADDANKTGEPLMALAARVRRVLDRMPVTYDHRPFVPHVTLLRGVAQSEAKRFDAERVAPVVWRVDSIALYRSKGGRSGSRYTRVLD